MTITRGLQFADYLDLPGVHFSALKHVDVSPRHYLRAVEHDRKDTDALRFGRAVHALTLTPDAADVAVWCGGVRRGKDWEAFKAEHADATILTEKEADAATEMRQTIIRHPLASSILSWGEGEVSVQWTDSETGLPCKCRADWAHLDLVRGLGLYELKTARASHPRSFMRSFATMGYHAQLAFYVDGLETAAGERFRDVRVIAVEKTPPFDVCVYTIPDEVLEVGRRKYTTWLRTVAECHASGRWPGAGGDDAVPMVLPEWATDDDPDVDTSGIEGGGEHGDE